MYNILQQRDGIVVGSAGNVSTTAFASLTPGSTLLCVVVYYTTQTTVTLSGAGSPTWTTEPVEGDSGVGVVHAFSTENIAGGTTTALTATFGTNVDYPAIYVVEVSGLKASGGRLGFGIAFDATPNGTDAAAGDAINATAQPALSFALSYPSAGDELASAGTGYTGLTGMNDYGGGPLLRPAHKRLTSTGNETATFTYSATGGDGVVISWIFEEAASGSGVTITTNGLAVPLAFGTSQAALDTNLTLTGIAVATAFGSAVVAYNEDIICSGLALPLGIGTASISSSGVLMTPNGLAVPISFISANTTASLEWEAVDGADEYRIKFGTSPGVYTGSYDTGSTATSANISDTSMAPGTVYYVVVCPLDLGVEGDPSPEVRILPGGIQLSSENELTFSGINVPVAFGTQDVEPDLAILPTGLALPLAFGTEELTRSNETVTLTANGLPLALAFGTENVTLTGGPVTLIANGLALPTAFGTGSLARGTVTLTLSGIALGAYVGRPILYDPLIGPPDLEDRTHWRPRKMGWIVPRRWRMR